MKKSIQVYGLPRSGTNYLEYLIRNNIDCNYTNEYKENSPYFEFRTKVALKHTKPDESYADYHVIILKKSGNFINSYVNWKKCNRNEAIETYKKAINDYLKFYKDNINSCIIIFHEDLINNENIFIEKLKDKFNLKQKTNEIICTEKRMNKSGGKGVINQEYKFINHDEIEINNEYYEIKKFKLI